MIILMPVEDLDCVRDVYSDPELFERIKEDDVTLDEMELDADALYFRLETPRGLLVGIAQFEFETSVTLRGHCNVLQPHRTKYSDDVGFAMLDWFVYDSPPQIEKLQVNIPVIYPDVIGFVRKFGFQDEGLRRHCIIKGNELTDEFLGGITRREAALWLQNRLQTPATAKQ